MNRAPPPYRAYVATARGWQPWSPPSVAFSGVDGGECSADVLKITWPSQVDDFKARLAPIAQGIDASVKSCAALTQADRDSWSASFLAWTAFSQKKTPLFGSSNEWETACTWARTFDAWRSKLQQARCAIAGPNEIQTEKTNPVDLARWITYGVVAVTALGGLVLFAPEIKAGLATLRRK